MTTPLYNQITTQKQFGNYTETQWQADCLSCNNTSHLASQPISEDCQMCFNFAPQNTTLDYFDTIFYSLILIIPLITIALFRSRKK
jgi:hypothetical protein